jgi:hypothetical protein
MRSLFAELSWFLIALVAFTKISSLANQFSQECCSVEPWQISTTFNCLRNPELGV